MPSLYSKGQMQGLGALLGGRYSDAVAINDSGQVTGSFEIASGVTHAFLYSNEQVQDLGTLLGGSYSLGSNINNSGQVIGSAGTADKNYAFLYSNGQLQDLGTLGGDSTSPMLLTTAAK
jgi:probable HAF family extracellular repeat protein